MGMADTVTKQYMRENTVFADAFNFLLYDGESVIQPEKLKELDTTELAVPFAVDNTDNRQAEAVQKYRDILKMTTVMTDDTAAYVLLGVESQTDIHYAMPVRNIIYDALQYGKQVSEISARNRKKSKQTRREFLSGFHRDDKLIPVITLVIHFGADKWDAPMSLHEMMVVTDKNLLKHIPDYRIKLIDPSQISSDEMDKFQTSLREVLCYIKYSKNADKFAQYMKNNRRMEHLELNAAQVIRAVTNTKFQIPKGTEVVNVCEAVEVLMERRKNEGIQQGLEQGKSQGITQGKLSLLQDLINDGTLTIEAAAAKADMTVEEFTESIKKL